jgi:hypothetical protein
MVKGEAVMELLLIGGKFHGTTRSIPDNIPFQIKDRVNEGLLDEKDGDNIEYVICKTGDGKFYGVYDPVYDPSIERIKRLRQAITEAIGE